MKFGVTILPNNYTQLPGLARMAEKKGFDYIGIAESQSLFHELYVSLGMVAPATKRLSLGQLSSGSAIR